MIMLKDLRIEDLFVCYNAYMKNSKVFFIRKHAALDLWEFGEDAYIERTLRLSDDDLAYLGERTYSNFNKDFYKKSGRNLPDSGYDIGLVTALTLIEHFEGSVRPLKRNRRRSHAGLPESLKITKEDYLEASSKSSRLWPLLKNIIAKFVQ
jgi:hypothetical protein